MMSESAPLTLNRPTLPVKGKNHAFDIARVFCIGRNYSKNPSAEVKNEQNVVLFMKDPFMISSADGELLYPNGTHKLRHEIELVVAIGKGGKDIATEASESHILGYAAGIDFTKYDVQEHAKQAGYPWDLCKSFPGCAPCTSIIPKEKFKPSHNRIWLTRNGEEVQDGHLGQMIWTIPEIISMISRHFTLLPGDLIFTGTPIGAGMTEPGDYLVGGIDGLVEFNLMIK